LPVTADSLAEAAARLRAGRLVAFPTETVYGLGGDATNPHAVAAIYAAKGRPSFNPLISHVADLEHVAREGRLSPLARTLAEAFWPGPMTLVLPRAETCSVCDLTTSGLPTLALRVPAHPTAHALLTAAGRPIAGPSANRSGHVSATAAAHVAEDLAAVDVLILDAGPTQVGLESTVIDATGDEAVILRHGGIARSAIEEVTGRPVPVATGEAHLPTSPGMLARHYAPQTPVRLNALAPLAGEAWLGFGADPADAADAVARASLSRTGDLLEAAANLFAALRALDTAGARAIAVAPIPAQGLGEAINDRLRRAALGRG
jgi:L-threonylcarbamoyladenylate synthase